MGQISSEKRFVLIMDEITYVMQANPELPSLIQRRWDHNLKQSNLFLILTGSLAGIIQHTQMDVMATNHHR